MWTDVQMSQPDHGPCGAGVYEGEGIKQEKIKIFYEVMTKTFPDLRKIINSLIQESQWASKKEIW